MRTCIFDLETSSLYADTGILLCSVIKEYGSKEPSTVIRADQFKSWGKSWRANLEEIVEATLRALDDFDIYVAHNGQYFDKTMLTSWALKFGARRVALRFAKFIDPVMLARRHMRLSRRSLAHILQFFDIKEEKTSILWAHWMNATLDKNTKSLGYIVDHCIADVVALERAYGIARPLIKEINERGSAF